MVRNCSVRFSTRFSAAAQPLFEKVGRSKKKLGIFLKKHRHDFQKSWAPFSKKPGMIF